MPLVVSLRCLKNQVFHTDLFFWPRYLRWPDTVCVCVCVSGASHVCWPFLVISLWPLSACQNTAMNASVHISRVFLCTHTHKHAHPRLDSHLEDASWFTANAKHFHKIDNEHCFWWMQREMDERKGRGKHKSRWRERKSDGNEWGLVSQIRGNSASYWRRSATAAHQRKHEGNKNENTRVLYDLIIAALCFMHHGFGSLCSHCGFLCALQNCKKIYKPRGIKKVS